MDILEAARADVAQMERQAERGIVLTPIMVARLVECGGIIWREKRRELAETLHAIDVADEAQAIQSTPDYPAWDAAVDRLIQAVVAKVLS